jgi:hypothetical protein
MPRVPDASSVTRLRAIQSSAVADPTKRSASYTPAAPALLYSLRASDAGRGMFPAESYLSNPVACGWVNPRHQGFITRPSTTSPTFPVVQIPLPSGVDFSTEEYVDYDFELNLPPGPDFDAILVAGAEPPTNLQDIIRINISTTDNAELFENTTMSTSPEWPAAVASSTTTRSRLNNSSTTTFPGMSTIIQFRNVPVIANLQIRFYGVSY